MTDDEAAARLDRMRERQDGGYQPPILAEPKGGPIPEWRPANDDQDETDG